MCKSTIKKTGITTDVSIFTSGETEKFVISNDSKSEILGENMRLQIENDDLKAQRDYWKRLYEEAVNYKLCIRCGTKFSMPGDELCPECYKHVCDAVADEAEADSDRLQKRVEALERAMVGNCDFCKYLEDDTYSSPCLKCAPDDEQWIIHERFAGEGDGE